MTTALIPIPENVIFWSNLLFNLDKPVVVTTEEFDSTVYTTIGGALT